MSQRVKQKYFSLSAAYDHSSRHITCELCRKQLNCRPIQCLDCIGCPLPWSPPRLQKYRLI